MSSSLYWRYVPKLANGKYFGYSLKFPLAKKIFGHDGSLISDWVTVGKELIPFLEGIETCSCQDTKKEARELIELIEKHGDVQISLQD